MTGFWRDPRLAAVPGVTHGFSLRGEGVSAPPFDALNLGLHVGDDARAVLANRCAACDALGFSLDALVCAEQVHGGEVAAVGQPDAGRGARAHTDALRGVDALVTDVPGLLLGLYFADCVPVFLADADGGAVGVAHGGWRGLAAGIVENTVAALSERYGVPPARLVAAVGPCISAEAFEVGPEVAARFPDETVWRPGAERPRVDLARAARNRLAAAGVPGANIAVSGECTSARSERYFSHRRDGGKTGRMGAFLGLRPRG